MDSISRIKFLSSKVIGKMANYYNKNKLFSHHQNSFAQKTHKK